MSRSTKPPLMGLFTWAGLMPMGYWGTQAAGRMNPVLLGATLVVGAFVWTMITYRVATLAATVLSLSNVGGLALGLLAITPVLLITIGLGYVTTDPRLSHRVMGGVLVAAAPITWWIEAFILRAYLRRPVHRGDLSGRQSRD